MRATLAAAAVVLSSLSVPAEAKAESLRLTDEQLLAYTGKDPAKPIYLAIKGEIYDVSAQPGFYGPGGHYGHFAGRDATRAWVTECWDSADQLTHRMDGVEAMFMPKYLDEAVEASAGGSNEADALDLGGVDVAAMKPIIDTVLARFGHVTAEEKEKRRSEDVVEARKRVDEVVEKWRDFFASNPKYPKVGTVVRDDDAAGDAPPPPCEAAMKKRPLKGGKLDTLVSLGKMGAAGAKASNDEKAKKGEMPDFVKKILEETQKKKEQEAAAQDGRDEL